MKDKILEILKLSNEYISGEELSKRMGVTRAAVWKVIAKLKEEGYVIESVTNRGYRLVSSPDVLTGPEISPYLTTEKLGRNVFFYSITDSTNRRARVESENGAPDGSLFIAEEQTAGRGRLGKMWIAPPKTGVWMTLLLRPSVQPEDITQITLLAGLAVCRAIENVTGLPAQIKWPNDVVIRGKKVCGILTEMSAEAERIECLICGMGINVNTESFPEDISNAATSLFLESGIKQPRARLAAEVMNCFEKYYVPFLMDGVTDSFLEEYKSCCVTLGRDIRAIQRGEVLIGTAEDITEKGELLIRSKGETLVLSSGEVSVRGLLGYV